MEPVNIPTVSVEVPCGVGASIARLCVVEVHMRTRMRLIVSGILFLTAIAARADKVTFDYDHKVNFSHYKTFMWIREPETKEPFMKERIISAINAQLIGRGFQLVDIGADLAIGANFATEEKHTWETYYDGSGWGWWGGGWASTTEHTYEVGTLTVDLFDAESKKLVWQGVATDTVSSKPEKRTKNCYKQVKKIFKDFPPAASE